MLTGSLLRLSPVLTRFSRNFFRSAFSLPSWSFEARLLRMQIEVRDKSYGKAQARSNSWFDFDWIEIWRRQSHRELRPRAFKTAQASRT